MQKKTATIFHCGPYDHLDLQSLDNYIFPFPFCNCNFWNLGACNTLLERYFQDISNGILQAPNFFLKKLVDQKNKYALKFLSFRCPTLFDETYGSKFNG
jgi:hypothetical protein